MFITIFSILLCLTLQRFINIGGVTNFTWVEYYLKMLTRWLLKINKWWGMLLILLPVLAVFGALNMLFTRRLFELFNLILASGVLFFAMDARGINHLLSAHFLALDNGSTPVTPDNVVVEFVSDMGVATTADINRAVTQAILVKSLRSIFSVIFWFVVFGIYGVTTYVLVGMTQRLILKINPTFNAIAELATKLQIVFEWLPVRLLVLSFALVGSKYKEVLNYFLQHWSSKDAKQLVIGAGLIALAADDNETKIFAKENVAVLDLIDRSLTIWILAIILFALGKWF